MTKKEEIMDYLNENIFNPVLDSKKASESLKKGIRYTIMRLNQRDAAGIRQYYWSAVIGTERSIKFASMMKQEGFTRFEELIEEFRIKFDDKWLNS
ncbi:hypothetical protein [Paraclostridium bifermentans]|uniref:hypothetical protein n=1 Tax=Paraclostridium bifermentans TaxID=1490 RepID=UPI00374FD5E4